MSVGPTVHQINLRLAVKINEEALGNPQSPYANKVVGIANGEVVVVADDMETACRRLEELEPDPYRRFVIEASHDYRPDPTLLAIHQELARRINEEALRDPQSPYAGKFVGLANGQVVVVADDLQTVSRRLGELEPDNRRCCIIEASRDYTIPVYV
jgi:tetrahydromethanopterin S-methyltransferase subunit G